MKELPEKLPREIRKDTREFGNWQDDVTSPERARFLFKFFQEILTKYGLDLTKNMKVLEIGSGNAVFLDFLKKQGVDAVGIDVQLRGSTDSPQIVGRVERLPFKDNSFDVVLSNAVFDELVYEQYHDIMMQEIFRVLKSGGMYLGSKEWRMHDKNTRVRVYFK
jgi:ubiquinone/menaquinone biosynthesis C-methylase UbiE